MKINYIKYKNYRCFEDMTVKFDTCENQNISLVLGVNGTGKTEMLFSFQWVLYGFNFKNLREKEETPYSLNSGLYHKLETDRNPLPEKCKVELSFTHNGTEYFVTREETFSRINNKITSFERVSFSHTEPNGERSTPEHDIEIIEKRISRIIPKSILEGITFDGERMKKLNEAEQSKETIKNVISLVTNEKLFELCSEEIKDLKGDISKEKKKINKDSGNTTAEELIQKINDCDDSIEDYTIQSEGIKKNLEKTQKELEEISEELGQLEEAKNLEQKRLGLQKDLERVKKESSNSLEQFYKRLVDGYTLITDKLVSDVKQSLENIDIPTGLTVEAVKSILKRPKCICGCNMTDDVVRRLTDMIQTLPPDNISSTILYMANQFDGEKKRSSELLKEAYDSMINKNEELAKLKKDISEISTALTEGVSEKVKVLEERRIELIRYEGTLTTNQVKCELETERLKKERKEAKKKYDEVSDNQRQLLELNSQQSSLEKFKDAIDKIKEKNSELSLESINEYLSSAYDKLSEDYGRSIYICQYEKKEKYRLVTFVKSKFDETKTRWINTGFLRTLEQEGLSENEIKERLILKVKEGKSTGQSKVNSLAFAKAVLDFSNKERSSDPFIVSHDYPFLIDSPFTELSGGNLINVAENIHLFANQIILMADNKSYSGIQQYVQKFVSSTTELIKNNIKGVTNIR